MDLLLFTSFLVCLSGVLFILHFLRHHSYHGPYIMFIAFLWFLIYLTGQLGYKISVEPAGLLKVDIRYSSAVYTLIFAGILLVYICEGVRESRNLILVSLGSQLIIALAQVFLFNSYTPRLLKNPDSLIAAGKILEPSLWRLSVGIGATVIDLFFAILFFQFLANRLRRVPMGFLIFASLATTMFLDSVIFVGLTRWNTFLPTLQSHLIFKTIISAGLAGPMALYIRWFQKRGHLDLNRGSLDIFSKIDVLEKDLERANQELRQYADGLEQMVEERTREIREKQAIMDLELKMAADLQKSMLPGKDRLRDINYAIQYLPCSSVSGDLYDLGRLSEDYIYFFMGDISGHGVPSALVGAMFNTSLSRINLRESSPARILSTISRETAELSGSHYLTGVFVFINLRERILTYASGAHPPPYMIGPSRDIVGLEPTGSIIGGGLGDEFKQKRVQYKAGTRLVIFTDCVIEHKNSEREEYGNDRLMNLLVKNRAMEPAEIQDAILKDIREFGNNAPFTDDLTLLIVDLP